MKRRILVLLAVIIMLPNMSFADEGMWLPMFIKRLNYKDMQEKGLRLTPEEIYDVNNSSIKDAIVRLGRGFCTGEVISDQGLFLTNHHCGFSVIQEKSSVEHDYLTDGFWAMNKEEELPAGFSVSFLVRMEDVSERIKAELKPEMTEAEMNIKAREMYKEIEKEATEGTHYEAQVKSFYKGNEFYLFIYETFNDVRLVGAPPSSIGKYGGDTDNWMWPRHTGDFTMFRIYADKDNKPAEYSKDNQPYKPRHHLPIYTGGVEEGDYAMIFGYPGSTDRYLTSYGVKLAVEKDQPSRVKIRRTKLDIYEEGQAKNAKTRIQYAAKHAQVSNYWKYFIGQTKGLKRLKVYDKKKAEEEALMKWINADAKRKEEYGDVLKHFEEGYAILDKVQLIQTYFGEAIFGTEILAFSLDFSSLANMMDKSGVTEQGKSVVEQLKAGVAPHFKDYNQEIDKKVMAAMLEYYYNDIAKEFLPQYFKDLVAKNKNDFNKIAESIFAKSIFGDEAKVNAFLEKPSAKVLEKDPALNLMMEFLMYFRGEMGPKFQEANSKIQRGGRLYVKALREMNPDKSYAPDANSTMRVTYGNVLSYIPQDAAHYNYFTTIEGIMEKEDPTSSEFTVPAKLKELYEKKDYGRYARKDGKMQVCFISNNDITGGNSGSPVINGYGELIGTAFDGNWEAMSGDIAFEDKLQRTISVDIRYTLWIIDKFAGAGHLVKEMTLVNPRVKTETAPAKEIVEEAKK